jgi:hypothetical protein
VDPRRAALFALAILVGLLPVACLYNRAVARRLRDVGHGKALAYVGLIPFVNVAVAVYLLIKPSGRPGGGCNRSTVED